jgi:hypothetical protein
MQFIIPTSSYSQLLLKSFSFFKFLLTGRNRSGRAREQARLNGNHLVTNANFQALQDQFEAPTPTKQKSFLTATGQQ